MRLAVITDIHGSLSSLEAVIREIHVLAVDGLLEADDMTCGPNSAEVLHCLQAEHAWVVLGSNQGYLDAAAESSDWERTVA
jgi:hypothetical protein